MLSDPLLRTVANMQNNLTPYRITTVSQPARLTPDLLAAFSEVPCEKYAVVGFPGLGYRDSYNR